MPIDRIKKLLDDAGIEYKSIEKEMTMKAHNCIPSSCLPAKEELNLYSINFTYKKLFGKDINFTLQITDEFKIFDCGMCYLYFCTPHLNLTGQITVHLSSPCCIDRLGGFCCTEGRCGDANLLSAIKRISAFIEYPGDI